MRPLASSSRRSLLLPLTLACCWTLWEVASSAGWAFKAPKSLGYIIRYTSVDGLLGLAACGLLFWTYNRLRRHLEFLPLVLLVVPLCFLAAVLWHTASLVILWRLGWNDRLYLGVTNVLVGGGLMDGITLALFSMLFFAVDHWLQLRDQREKAREATALAHQAQLKMLRYQLNPHFLFNTLNSIRAMIMREPDRARQIVTELAEFLRYSLDGHGPDSTVGEEMEAIASYLAIQRIRFEEKLAVTVRVDPELEGYVVPCFLVHPLVENAVKYGMETSEPPLRLEIEITPAGRGLRIRVSNTGRLVAAAPGGTNGTGIGLQNVAQRLELAFPGRHAFTLTERDGWVHAEISLQPAAEAAGP